MTGLAASPLGDQGVQFVGDRGVRAAGVGRLVGDHASGGHAARRGREDERAA